MDGIIKAVTGGLTIQLLLPATMLGLLFMLFAVIFIRAQGRPDFDFADMLRGDDGKVSPWRFFAFGAFSFSTWVLMSEVLNARLTDQLLWSYSITWAGSPSLLKFVEKWNGSLPFAKGPNQP